MTGSVTDWVAERISPRDGLAVISQLSEHSLLVKPDTGVPFPVAVIGVKGGILPAHVEPALSGASRPQFIVNVPSKSLWSGQAISLIHDIPAAYGTLGELAKAARMESVPTYRNNEREFFYRAIRQHSNVSRVSLVYEAVFEAHRRSGRTLTIALVDAYNLSAEDVRNAKDRFGSFDIAVKTSSYGSVTSEAEQAAAASGMEALMFKSLMQRLAR